MRADADGISDARVEVVFEKKRERERETIVNRE